MVLRRFGVLPKNVRPIGEEIRRRSLRAAKSVMDINEKFDVATKKITRRR